MYKVLKDFRGSPDGCRVISYTVGQDIKLGSDFSTDLAEVALAEGWVTKYLVEPGKPAKKKTAKAKK